MQKRVSRAELEKEIAILRRARDIASEEARNWYGKWQDSISTKAAELKGKDEQIAKLAAESEQRRQSVLNLMSERAGMINKQGGLEARIEALLDAMVLMRQQEE